MNLSATELTLFWAGVIALAILVYVVLDGFDLGVGILFGGAQSEAMREQMMNTIAPVWDGNQTWLVVIGAGLFAAFPVVYAVFLGAYYIPVLLLLIGLIFRGVAFEFRHRTRRMRGFWDKGFFWGSVAAAFVQGAAIGAMLKGIPVRDGQFAGQVFDWLRPLPLLAGVGLVLGYALLGAGWLVLKSEGLLRDWAYARIPYLAGAVLLMLVLAIAFTLERSEVARSQWYQRRFGLAFPLLAVAALLVTMASARWRRDRVPFAATVLFFVCAYLTLGTMFWPYMIPYEVTVYNAAAPESSLRFFFWGGLIVLPLITGYTLYVYWVFRGKVHTGYG